MRDRCGRSYPVWCCTIENRKLLDFVALQRTTVTHVVWNHQLLLKTATNGCQCEGPFRMHDENNLSVLPHPTAQSSLCGQRPLSALATHKDYCQKATTGRRTKTEPRTTADPHGPSDQRSQHPKHPVKTHQTSRDTSLRLTHAEYSSFLSPSLWSRDWNGWNGRRGGGRWIDKNNRKKITETWRDGEKVLCVPRDETKTFLCFQNLPEGGG